MCSNARECGEECKDYNECDNRVGALRLRRRVRLSVGGHGHSDDIVVQVHVGLGLSNLKEIKHVHKYEGEWRRV